MKRYCFDTSGISNPLETMPDDIHESIWLKFNILIKEGHLAVTEEIYEEMTHIQGIVGSTIVKHKQQMVLEVNDPSWNWSAYVGFVRDMQIRHSVFVSENLGHKAGTIGLNDLSIIALAKSLDLPLVSMERPVTDPNSRKRKIPDICRLEGVEHLDFNAFLRRERIKI